MNTEIQTEITIGIDVSQRYLDVYIRPLDQHVRVENERQAIEGLIQQLKTHRPDRVLIESTGRLELPFVCAASNVGLPVVVCDAAKVRQFAKAAGAKVTATSSSTEKLARLEELGADHLINYKELPDWGAKARELTGG